MRVVVSVEERFDRAPDGAVWTLGPFSYDFWTRYLQTFDQVCVIARVREVADRKPTALRADGPGVLFVDLPCYAGPWEYLRNVRDVRRAVRASVRMGDAVVLRVSSTLAAHVEKAVRRWVGYPYALEVVGDPYDVFAPKSIDHPLRPFLRWWFSRQLRRQCGEAAAVAYVTSGALQQRYATQRWTFQTHYSSVDLPSEAFAKEARAHWPRGEPIRTVFVGSLAQPYKAPDILIHAAAKCLAAGLEIRVALIGDGRYRAALEAQAAQAGLGSRVAFLGHLPPGQAVREQLDKADLFVLPSRVEGLPRAMIEAMARGLPCIGSTVGGIPELLSEDDLVPPGDAEALANRIQEIVHNPSRMTKMSRRNLAKAGEYRDEVLRRRRTEFYGYVRHMTEQWMARQRSA